MDHGSGAPATGLLASIVSRGAETLGISLPSGAPAAFEKYHDLLEQRGRNVNLTAISTVEDVARLHFLDSMAPLKTAIFANKRVIDIGSGAGFPGAPLAIAEPTIKLALLDATGKRIAFLTELCAMLGIDAALHHARAEDAAHDTKLRERFDIAVSRAVADLNTLCEMCLPFVSIGGRFLAMKGSGSDAEIENARGAIKTLGAEISGIHDYTIPETDIVHRIVTIKKIAPTPGEYPRRFAKMKKNPLK